MGDIHDKKRAAYSAATLLGAILGAEQKPLIKNTFLGKIRNRVLTPFVTLQLFIMTALSKESFNATVCEFNGWMNYCSEGARAIQVTAEAWRKARNRMPYQFLKRVFNLVVDSFNRKVDGNTRWKGFRVLAADGTRIRLQKSKCLKEIFGTSTNKQASSDCPPQATLVCMVLVFTGICTDFVVGAYRASEALLTNMMILNLSSEDLVLLDAGYVNFGLMGGILAREANFVVRGKRNFKKKVIKKLGSKEWLCRISVAQDKRAKYPGAPEEIAVRVVEFTPRGYRKIILMTSLTDPAMASAQEIADLYMRRWQIELVYRDLKHTLDIENVRSKSYLGVQKEIVSHLIANNLIRFVMQEAAEEYGNDQSRCAIDYSFKLASRSITSMIAAMMAINDLSVSEAYEKLKQGIAKYPIRKRPGRSYPRTKTNRAKRKRQRKLEKMERKRRKRG